MCACTVTVHCRVEQKPPISKIFDIGFIGDLHSGKHHAAFCAWQTFDCSGWTPRPWASNRNLFCSMYLVLVQLLCFTDLKDLASAAAGIIHNIQDRRETDEDSIPIFLLPFGGRLQEHWILWIILIILLWICCSNQSELLKMCLLKKINLIYKKTKTVAARRGKGSPENHTFGGFQWVLKFRQNDARFRLWPGEHNLILLVQIRSTFWSGRGQKWLLWRLHLQSEARICILAL